MRSLAFAMALTALIGEPTPVELVAMLGSADRIEREEAARTLEDLGDRALPALRALDPSAPEPVRARALSVARAIEGRLVDRPTLVPVDFDGQTLEEAVRSLADRTGFSIKVEARNDAGLPRRPIRARSPAPIPFWEALDLIGKAGRVRHDMSFRVFEPGSRPILQLVDGEPPTSTIYRGPFRVHLLSLHRRSDVDLSSDRDGRQPVPVHSLHAEVQAIAEPDRFVEMNGAARVEAVDDRGKALPPPSIDSLPQHSPSFIHRNAPGAIGLLQWRLRLGLPAEGASSLRTLRGTLPAMISARRRDPLVIDLDEEPGRPHRFEDQTISFQDVRKSPGNYQLELVAKPDKPRSPGEASRASSDPTPQFVFEDREGHPLFWNSINENPGPAGEKRVRAMLSGTSAPARVRCYGLVRMPVEIPFEFTDIPLP